MMRQAQKPKVALIFGTRPEAIKLAPLALALKADQRLDCRVWVTGQHRHMLDQVLRVFGISPDIDLNLMQPDQTLGGLTSRAIAALDECLALEQPQLILVQGDTTTVFCAALAAFYHQIPVGHVEAGLRTNNLKSPWPEEANRVLTSRLASLHFAPTESAKQNLLREGIDEAKVFVTGNTVIDALLWVRSKLNCSPDAGQLMVDQLRLPADFADRFLMNSSAARDQGVTTVAGSCHADPDFFNCSRHSPLILVTGHRRESFGQGFENLCQAIRHLVELHSELGVIYPVHLNPQVQHAVHRILGGHPRIQLVPPLGYEVFVWLMDRSFFILSDSGGVQEEAPSLGKPVLVMRDTTERPEGIAAGTCRLVGTNPDVILREARLLLTSESEYRQRSALKNPYGDGRATQRIVEACVRFLCDNKRARGIELVSGATKLHQEVEGI